MCRSESRLALFLEKAKRKGETTKQAFFQRFRFLLFSHPTWNERAVVVRIPFGSFWTLIIAIYKRVLNPHDCSFAKGTKRQQLQHVVLSFKFAVGFEKALFDTLHPCFFGGPQIWSQELWAMSRNRAYPQRHMTQIPSTTRERCVCVRIHVYTNVYACTDICTRHHYNLRHAICVRVREFVCVHYTNVYTYICIYTRHHYILRHAICVCVCLSVYVCIIQIYIHVHEHKENTTAA